MTTLQSTQDKLDALILEEKKRVALEFFNEAWTNAVDEGIEASILAETAVFTALSQLTEAAGDTVVAELVAELPERVECGHFQANRSIQ